MAMPPRLVKRRGSGQRWLIMPLIITVLVILADASMHARSTTQQVTMSTNAWVDAVLPQIGSSSTQGREIADLSSAPLREGSQPAAAQLSRLAGSAHATYMAVTKDEAPSRLRAAAGLLDACLAARQRGAQAMASAVDGLLRTGQGGRSTAVRLMGHAMSDFTVSDNAYRLFTEALPELGFRVPSSRWVTAATGYGRKGFQAFASRLVAGNAHVGRYGLAIDALSTQPPALSRQAGVQVLPPARTVSVTVVVSNTGRVALKGVRVSAKLSSATRASGRERSDTVNIGAGRSRSVVLTGLAPAPSAPTELTVTAAVGQGVGPAVRSVRIEVAGTNFDATTTTAGRGPVTTTTASSGSPATTTARGAATTTTSSGG